MSVSHLGKRVLISVVGEYLYIPYIPVGHALAGWLPCPYMEWAHNTNSVSLSHRQQWL